ncbi:MAG: hypothetical protein Q8R47_05205 [Nanoarchaeota archaeon]|nr:hypothetical protein [Nanoarchaeota archaeon]
MKKIVNVIITMLILIFLIGCANYKAQSRDSQNKGDTRLIDEIAKIEQELQLENKPVATENELPEVEETEVEEVVALPGPTEESTENGEMQVIEVDENEMVKLNVKVHDPDQDSVEYTFTPPLNKLGQWKTNYGDAGEYVVSLTATDGKLTTEKKLKVVVNRVNVPPVVSGVADLHVKEGEVVNFKPIFSDPNGDKVTVTISDPLQGGTFATDHTSAGEYQVKVVASDGELTTEKSLTLLVDDVNELPVLAGLQDLVVKEGELVTVKPTVTDLDEDEVTVTVSEPVGNSGVWKTSYTDHGEYLVTVTANDGKGVVTKKIKVVVEDVNMPPEIVEVKLAVN